MAPYNSYATAIAANMRSGRPSKAQTPCHFYGGGGSSYGVAFDPANEAGVQDPVGFWDPLGFSDDKDEATFKRRRAVEIKHGRICMYATIGYMVPEYFKFPGYLSPSMGIQFADVPDGLGALSKVPLAGGLQSFASGKIAEYLFCFFFWAGLLLRLGGESGLFVTNRDEVWRNMFDALLVGASVFDLRPETYNADTMNLTLARTLRVIRFARVLRIVRVVRCLYSFRLTVHSTALSMVALVWVFVLPFFIMYFSTIFFMNGVIDQFAETEDLGSELSKSLAQDFGTSSDTLLSLSMDLLPDVGWLDGWTFLFHVVFMTFGVVSVVIAHFVDSAAEIESMRDSDYAKNLRKSFREAEVDKTGTLCREEFQQYDFDVSQARTFFKLRDRGNSNSEEILFSFAFGQARPTSRTSLQMSCPAWSSSVCWSRLLSLDLYKTWQRMVGKQEMPILMVLFDVGAAERRNLCHSTQCMREGIRAYC